MEVGTEIEVPTQGHEKALHRLMRFGGFPEPFLSGSTRTLRRWQKERLDRFVREDVRDLGSIRDLSSLRILSDLLPERVGSPLSLNALREDLEVAPKTLGHWMDLLEDLYFVYRVRPFATKRVRSLKKMPKAYLWDWSLVPGVGERFENLVGGHLLKFCNYLEDREGYDMDLHYLRDRTGREVDFLVTLNRRPWFAVECKWKRTDLNPALFYFKRRLKIPWAYQVIQEGDVDFIENGVRCISADRFLAALV